MRLWMRHLAKLRPANPRPASDREECQDRQSDSLLLAAALMYLPREEARILRLHHEAGFPFEAIGEMMGLDSTAVRASWSRGLRRLRRHYRETPDEAAWSGLSTFALRPCDTDA